MHDVMQLSELSFLHSKEHVTNTSFWISYQQLRFNSFNCETFQLFRSLVYFILPFTDVRNFSDRK